MTVSPRLEKIWQLFQRTFPGLRRRIVLVSTLAVCNSMLEAFVALFIAALASIVTNNTASIARTILDLHLVLTRSQLCVLAFAVVALRGVSELALVELKAKTEALYERRTRQRVADAFLHANWSLQFGEQAGRLQVTLLNFVSQGRMLLQNATDELVQIVGLLIMLAASFAIAGVVTLVAIAAMLAMGAGLLPFARHKRQAAEQHRNYMRDFSSRVTELVCMAKEIRVFAVQRPVSSQIAREIDGLARAQHDLTAASSRLTAANNTLIYLAVVGGLVALIVFRIGAAESYVAMVLLLYRAMIYGRGVQSSNQNVVGLLPYVEELDQRLRSYEQAVDTWGSHTIAGHVDRIVFDDVSYSYVPGHPALRRVSFTLDAGETVGIVGPSGSGKSTILQLLLGLRRPTEGRVTANGVEITSFDQASWASKVSLVPQEALLFDETIEANVRCFRDTISHDDVVQALREAQLLGEMLALPDGLATVVGEGGKKLSGGQRQRLCIARALAGKPDVLILDEPTSALDPSSEESIRQTLERLRGHVMLVIVAHRMSTLRTCGRVIVVNNGRLEAVGERNHLEATNEYYAEALRLARLV